MDAKQRTQLILATVRARHRSAALTDALHEVRPVALPVESEKTVAIPTAGGNVVDERRPTVEICRHAVRRFAPIIGLVCDDCRRKLSAPVILDGVVDGPSIMSLAVATETEFRDRSDTLRRRAAEILGVQ